MAPVLKKLTEYVKTKFVLEIEPRIERHWNTNYNIVIQITNHKRIVNFTLPDCDPEQSGLELYSVWEWVIGGNEQSGSNKTFIQKGNRLNMLKVTQNIFIAHSLLNPFIKDFDCYCNKYFIVNHK